ncbi:MAG: hypothetical protein ABFD00_02315 [Chloroherpetonaceae bacterium]|nr:hypothetical protein [bacterium]
MKMNTLIFIIAIFAAINCNASEINRDRDMYVQRTFQQWLQDPDSNLIKFSVDIINNPDKLDDIKRFYPEQYKEEYIYMDILDSISQRKELIKYIQENYTKIQANDTIMVVSLGFNQSEITDLKEHIKYQGVKLDEMFGFAIMKNKQRGIGFYFICRDGKYYFCSISKVLLPYALDDD